MGVLEKIKNKSVKYDLVAEYVNDNTLKIYSTKYLFDTWLIKTEGKRVNLYHSNKKGKRKCGYHLQNSFSLHKWFWCLQKINDHNKYVVNRKYYKQTDWVSDILNKHNERLYA